MPVPPYVTRVRIQNYKSIADIVDLTAARGAAPSFDKLWREVERLLGETQPPDEDPLS
jgi:hypothetical protein